ncbi:uncharacterized protein LOC113678250 isoform X1 [Pocillopora damicornis]|uniref:uncharacterized protein LOC113678250 isoform X1 n=2 Tax=Pocillopora damicornis TaxID=46731 RepID=UPI000F557C57|nr:uncharacterized protein LOC113678250 isoform X1 [Pocillopora damicornis]
MVRTFWTAKMSHLPTCILTVTVVLLMGVDFINGQYSAVTIPGHKIKIVGCYVENPAKRNIPVTLFSDSSANSKTKIDYKNFKAYILKAIQRCAAAAKLKKYGFFAMNNVGDCVSGKVSATYARSGSSANCKNAAGAKCNNKEDCVGGDTKANYVYKVEMLPTTPTTKPTTKKTTKAGTGATAQPKAGSAAQLSALICQNYVVAIKASAAGSPSKPAIPTPSKKPTVAGKSTGPTVATPTTSAKASGQSAIEAKVKNLYRGYTCLVCLRTLNTSSSTVYLMLQFSCQGQHLQKLVAGIGASNIVKAECYPPPCTTAMSPCPLPCGMNSCPMSPASSYPSICPATLPAPAPLPAPPLVPPQCPAPCPTRCAPACNSLCCRSMVRQKSITGEAAKKSSTKEADDFDDEDDDAEDDEQDDDVEENDDSDIDETN